MAASTTTKHPSERLAPSYDGPLIETIAAATRPVHAKLNKLILARLPLALPPRATDPSVYVSGLLHIAPIYLTFEALWQSILDTPPATKSVDSIGDGCDPGIPLLDNGSILTPNHDDPKVHRPLVCGRMHSMLEHLHLPGLMRSTLLKSDIRNLTGWPDHIVEEQLRVVGQMGRLGDFTSHIKRAVENKPHVLLAYSYILFMALFAGGRFIRASLESVGEPFWEHVPSPVKPMLHPCSRNDPHQTQSASGLTEAAISEGDKKHHSSHTMPLRFFHFPTPMDGEDLKREFKSRLADAEKILTPREKHDIVQEAVCIFDNVALVVHQLDLVCAEPDHGEDDDDAEISVQFLTSLLKNPLGARLRDSVSIAKERVAKSSSKRSSSSDGNGCMFITSKEKRKASSSEGANLPETQGHPHISSMNAAAAELCPAMSKSIRFESKLPQPVRNPLLQPEAAAAEIAGNLKMATKRVPSIHVTNLVLVAAFGAIVIGMLLTGRRGLIDT